MTEPPVSAQRAKDGQVKLSMGGQVFSGTVRFLTGCDEEGRAIAAIRRKYWMFRPTIELGRFLAAGVTRGNKGSFEVSLAR